MINVPFSIYILRKNNEISNLMEWFRTVFYIKNKVFTYLYLILGLAIYFLSHIILSRKVELTLPLYTFFLSLLGNLIIGGLEEAGWMFILQPELDKKYGYILSSIYTGIIWILWHIPLFFIAGTNHGDGLINFWMFNTQLIAFRFFYGAIYKISGQGRIFMCVLFHIMFNAASSVFSTMTTNWGSTIVANAIIIMISIITVCLYDKRKGKTVILN